MSFKFKFCRECGAKSTEEWTGYYSPETGEKITISVCSQNRCHTSHDERPQPLFARGDWKCSRCGHIGHWYGGI